MAGVLSGSPEAQDGHGAEDDHGPGRGGQVSIGLGVGDDFETAHDVSEFAGRDHDEGGATTGSGEV